MIRWIHHFIPKVLNHVKFGNGTPLLPRRRCHWQRTTPSGGDTSRGLHWIRKSNTAPTLPLPLSSKSRPKRKGGKRRRKKLVVFDPEINQNPRTEEIYKEELKWLQEDKMGEDGVGFKVGGFKRQLIRERWLLSLREISTQSRLPPFIRQLHQQHYDSITLFPVARVLHITGLVKIFLTEALSTPM